MKNSPKAGTHSAGTLDPLAIVLALHRGILVIAAFALVAVVMTGAYVFTVPSIYTAWTKIVVDPSSRKPFDDPNAPSPLGNEALAIDTQLAVISSAAVLRPVVEEHKLADDPEFGGTGGGGGFFSRLGLSSGAQGAAELEPRMAQATLALGKALTVSRDGATYVISIGVQSRSASKSAELSMAVANAYLREQQHFQQEYSRRLAEQIDDRLIGLRERLRETEEKVQEYRAKKRLQSGVDGGLLVGQELGGLSAQLVEARSAFASAKAANQAIQRYLKREIEPTALGEIVTSPRVTQLLEEYSRAVRAEASLASDLLPLHPSLVRAKSEVARISKLIHQEIAAIGEGKKIELDVAQERVTNLERQMDSLRDSSNVDEQGLIVLRELETEAKTTRAVYENVLSRAKQAANLEQFTTPIARIITPAQPPETASWPKRKVLLTLAAAIGLMTGIAVVVIVEVWRQLRASPFFDRLLAPVAEPVVEPAVDTMVASPKTEEIQSIDRPAKRRVDYTGSVKVPTGYPRR